MRVWQTHKSQQATTEVPMTTKGKPNRHVNNIKLHTEKYLDHSIFIYKVKLNNATLAGGSVRHQTQMTHF